LVEEELPAEREVLFQIFLIRDESVLALAWGARVSFELMVTASSSWGVPESSPGKKDIWLPSGESPLLATEEVSERLGPS